MQLRSSWRISIGSSIVTMWHAARRVDVADDRRERGRLARAGRARAEDEAAAARSASSGDALGQPERRRSWARSLGITRNANEIAPRWRNPLTRRARQAGRRVGEIEVAGLRRSVARRAGSCAVTVASTSSSCRLVERRPAFERGAGCRRAGGPAAGRPSGGRRWRRRRPRAGAGSADPREPASADPRACFSRILLMRDRARADTRAMAVQPLPDQGADPRTPRSPPPRRIPDAQGPADGRRAGAGACRAGAERAAARPGADRSRPDHHPAPRGGAGRAARARLHRPRRDDARRRGGGAAAREPRPALPGAAGADRERNGCGRGRRPHERDRARRPAPGARAPTPASSSPTATRSKGRSAVPTTRRSVPWRRSRAPPGRRTRRRTASWSPSTTRRPRSGSSTT